MVKYHTPLKVKRYNKKKKNLTLNFIQIGTISQIIQTTLRSHVPLELPDPST